MLAALACEKVPRRAEPERPDAAPTRPFTLQTSAGPVALGHGKAFIPWPDAPILEIRLSDAPGPCGSDFEPPWTHAAMVVVPPVPIPFTRSMSGVRRTRIGG